MNLTTNWKLLTGITVVGGLIIALLLSWNQVLRTEQQRDALAIAHRITVANYRIAQSTLRIKMANNLKRVAEQRQQVNERIIYVYQEKRSATAIAGERLREQAASYLGNPGSPQVSTEREATCRAVAGTSCEAIPALLKGAQENTDQLLALIEWAKAQAEVSTNPEE